MVERLWPGVFEVLVFVQAIAVQKETTSKFCEDATVAEYLLSGWRLWEAFTLNASRFSH